MNSLLLWPVLNEISIIGLTFAFLSVVFFFFFVKQKFKKTATIKAYSILFFAFVFYTIASFSFVFLNALNTFFNLGNFLFTNYIWFLPFCLCFGLVGALLALFLYFIGQKLFKEYVFKAMNLSLLILLPSLVYYLFFWPYKRITEIIIQPIHSNQLSDLEVNVKQFETRQFDAGKHYISAIPSQLFDSLVISSMGENRIQFINNANGFSYVHQIPMNGISQLYVAPIYPNKQLAILALSPSVVGNAVLFICDSMGAKIYQNKYDEFVNRMSVSEDGNYLLLQKTDDRDSSFFFTSLKLKP